jgi:hypothetical protein
MDAIPGAGACLPLFSWNRIETPMNVLRLLLVGSVFSLICTLGCSSASTSKGPSLTEEEKKAQIKKEADQVMQERKKV